MRQRTQDPIGRPLPRPQDNSARDGGTLMTFGAIPRGIVVSPTRRCVAVAAPGTGQAGSVRQPLTPYDDPAPCWRSPHTTWRRGAGGSSRCR